MLHGLCGRCRSSSRSGGRSLLSRGGGLIGLSLSGGGLSLSRFQGGLKLGDDLGVYGSLGRSHGRVESCLSLSRGGRSLLGPSGGRISLSLSGGGLSLSRGGLSLSRGRGGLSLGLSRGGVAVCNGLIVVAAGRGHQSEGQQCRQPANQVLPVSHMPS